MEVCEKTKAVVKHVYVLIPVTTKSVKIRRQQQQKLMGLWDAASEGRKRRLKASLQTHNTAAPCNTPSMARTKTTCVQHIERLVFFFCLRVEELRNSGTLLTLNP